MRHVALALVIGSGFALLPRSASGQSAKFQIEEATIETIQAAIVRGELTSTRIVRLYLNRIKAHNGTCVNQPAGILGAGPITPIESARQLNALLSLNLRPAKRQARSIASRAFMKRTQDLTNVQFRILNFPSEKSGFICCFLRIQN